MQAFVLASGAASWWLTNKIAKRGIYLDDDAATPMLAAQRAPDRLCQTGHRKGAGMTQLAATPPLVLVYALVAGFGALLAASGLGLLLNLPVRLGNRIQLGAEQDRIDGITPDADSFGNRVLAPLIQALIARTGEGERLWVERAYDLLDRARGSSEYYTKKIVCGTAGFACGVLLGLNFADAGLLPLLVLAWAAWIARLHAAALGAAGRSQTAQRTHLL